jgi:hypothetical protein
MRTVISVDPSGEKDAASGSEIMALNVDRSPFNIPSALEVRQLKLAPEQLPAWAVPNAVRVRGQMVRDGLRSHPGVAAVLDSLAQVPGDQIQPIFVKLRDGNAELITWETLCDAQDQFVALDRRWPVGRISDPWTSSTRPPPVLRLPVRVMAVISAFGVKGQKRECQLMREAVEAARAAGLDACLKFLVGEESCRADLDAAIGAGRPWLEVSHIEKTGPHVVQDILTWKPNVLHFFCHGHSNAFGQSLELATASDYSDPGAVSGSVAITVKQLTDVAGALGNPWLLTLNCCSSGEAAADLQSMAHKVVTAGFPAAVAMLEPVDAADAHEFTQAFYSTLFLQLKQAKARLAEQPPVPFEWASVMYDARTAICELHGDAWNSREWVLPILYVRGIDPSPFQPDSDVPEATASDYKVRARLVAEWLQEAGATMTADQRLRVMGMSLAGVPPRYWPKADGTFADV